MLEAPFGRSNEQRPRNIAIIKIPDSKVNREFQQAAQK